MSDKRHEYQKECSAEIWDIYERTFGNEENAQAQYDKWLNKE